MLRKWVTTQRSAYNGKVNCNMTQEKIKLLEEIGMNFKIRDNDEEWNKRGGMRSRKIAAIISNKHNGMH